MEIIEFGRLTDRFRADLEGDEDDPFSAAGATLQYRRKERHVALRAPDGRLAASTGMLATDVSVGAERFGAIGLGGVIVRVDCRGRGLCRRIVEAALDRAATLGPQFALLFCLPDRAGLYRKLGFTEIGDPVQVQQPGGYAPMPDHTMWRALTADATWPSGPVTVHSLPF